MSSSDAEAAFAELLQYPFLWPPKKILNFGVCLRKKLDDFQTTNPEFRLKLNQAAQKLGVLQHQEGSGQWNWGNVFKPDQLNVLTSFYNKYGQRVRYYKYEYCHVTDLVVAFRHRYEHLTEIPEDDKELLFGTKSITDQVYVSFWISKFPKLLGFLWIRFKGLFESDIDLKPYYPPGLKLPKKVTSTHVSWFSGKLNAAVARIKSHGFLEGKYALNDKTLTFYEVSSDLIHNIISTGSSATTISISRDQVTVQWTTHENSLTHVGKSSQSGTLVFAHKLVSDQVQQTAIVGSSDNVLYFVSNLSNIAEILQDVSNTVKEEVREIPLVLSEFEKKCFKRVLNTKVSVWKESEMLELWTLLSPSEIEHNIKGKDLNRILRGSEFCIFKKVSLPKVDQSVYLARNISFLQKNGASMIVSEADFCEGILKCQDPRQIIYISGKCGIGKSTTIESIAGFIYEKSCGKFVFLFPMRKFFENIGTSDISTDLAKRDVVKIFNTILCETDTERNLISYWFSSQTIVQRVRLEIIFDGLDEVPEEFLGSLYQIILLIRENCPCVRQWITSRDHMIKEFLWGFKINVYQLVPLTAKESVELTKRYFSRSLSLSEKFGIEKFKELESFCPVNCISCIKVFESDLVSVPLHCEMLAHFLVSNLIRQSGNESFGSILGSLRQMNYKVLMVNIFEHIVTQKCEYFLHKINLELKDSASSHTRKLHMTDMIRWATVLSLECVYGKQVRNCFEFRIIHDELVKKYVLNQGFVQSFNNLVFCHQSFCEFFVADFAFRVLSNDGYLGVNKNDISFKYLLEEKILNRRNDNVGGLFYLLCCKYENEGKEDMKHISKIFKDFIECECCIKNNYKIVYNNRFLLDYDTSKSSLFNQSLYRVPPIPSPCHFRHYSDEGDERREKWRENERRKIEERRQRDEHERRIREEKRDERRKRLSQIYEQLSTLSIEKLNIYNDCV